MNLSDCFVVNELSRIRTYIRNLEGFGPNPLDDELDKRPQENTRVLSRLLSRVFSRENIKNT